MGKIKTTGRVSKVEAKFCFIQSDQGAIFCPLAAAIPKDQNVPNLMMKYMVGDIVHVIAEPQIGKNQCNWLATKVRHVKGPQPSPDSSFLVPGSSTSQVVPQYSEFPAFNKSVTVDAEHISNVIEGTVISVTETLAYATTAGYGTVFLPGFAFDSIEVTRLNAYLEQGDRVLMIIQAQPEYRGICWRAVAVTKAEKQTDLVVIDVGKVTQVKETTAKICSLKIGEVEGKILNYNGGDEGREDAEWLTDIIKVGDDVQFTAKQEDNRWIVKKWNVVGSTPGEPRKEFRNVGVQTHFSAGDLVLRALEPEICQLLQEKPTLLSYYLQGQI